MANQGFTVGTEGYTRALADLQGRQAAERYNALDTAGNEAQRLFNMGMGARQQAFGEDLQSGQFGNQALGQAGALDMQRMGAMNAALSQQQGLNQNFADQQNRLRQQAIAVLRPVRRKSMIASSTEVVARNALNLLIGSPSSSR